METATPGNRRKNQSLSGLYAKLIQSARASQFAAPPVKRLAPCDF